MNNIMKNARNIIICNVNDVSANLLSDFINYLDVSPATVQTYSKSLRQMFNYFKENGISQPMREDILKFKNHLEATGHKATTIALYLAGARRFFTWCVQKGIYTNIAQGVKAPRISKGHKKDCFSAQQLKGILRRVNRNTLEGKRNFAVLALMTTCGLRTIEIVRANVEDIRLVGGTPVLYVQGKGRTDKADFVKLTEPVINAIRDYLTARGQVKGKAPLFASCSRRNRGGRLTTRTISGLCKKAMINAGYISPLLTAHSLRHSAVTIALMNGSGLADVQAFARHSSINTTMIYNHTVNRMKSMCELSVSNAIF